MFKVKIWERSQAFDLVCSDTLAAKKKKKGITKNVQLPFVPVHMGYAVSYTFQNRTLYWMTPKWPSRVNLSTLVSNLNPGSDLGFDKNKDQYALYILSY